MDKYAEAPRETNVDSFVNIAEQANDRMSDFISRLAKVTEQLCGSQPEAGQAAGASVRGVPNGYLENAAEHNRQIMTKLERGNSLLSRIERALP